MKKLILLLVICTSGLLIESTSAQVSFRINIGSQPMWGPVGYSHVEYYYLPDLDAYYFVPTHKYIYMDNGQWINRSYLPGRYRDYDMYNCRKVVINEPRPYMRDNEYRERYSRYNERDNQQSYRYNRESRNLNNRNYQEQPQWKQYNNNRGRHEGEGNGRKRKDNEGGDD